MEMDCLLDYNADNFFMGSLAEPVSCIIGAFHAQYHTTKGSYCHSMGIANGGSLALLGGAGPMGLCAVDYAMHNPIKPSLLVVSDIDDSRLERAAHVLPIDEARKNGVDLRYVNIKDIDNPVEYLAALNGGRLYDDVFVFAPLAPVLEMGDRLLGRGGCLNFFAGPTDTGFSANVNFYNVHYEFHSFVGTSGGSTGDMREALAMMAKGDLKPEFMITHIGGLDAAADATINLDKIPGGKNLIYTNKKLELSAIDDFAAKGKDDPFFAKLAEICTRHGGMWNAEAEKYLLENVQEI
jgi:threonine dehydrogenase-like Zn-dependent dehydrogenase